MGILSNIFHKIFPGSHPAAQGPAPTVPAAPTTAAAPASTPAAAPAPSAAPMQEVDVDAILSGMQASAGQPLNWRSSIVDLLKLLGLDSSLQSRKELAAELHHQLSLIDLDPMVVRLELTINPGNQE